ncbi:SDR family NAD(P)-dependent oxidoreductase [Streptomyces pacificus]|uniref:SDR family NAD(P)-dependent oxidoreductase n=1 Tax=Streptomyces pacificus TaxID=2705029 RepID=A0A6A0ASZ2_9ACTN|nr:SDR family NAD(P)-dependent oxidoreductase [Streptomyces pacificus]GFH35982.1 SDR family NAD(P)-dependent oxidoreductase [Streptomyces pacificus]
MRTAVIAGSLDEHALELARRLHGRGWSLVLDTADADAAADTDTAGVLGTPVGAPVTALAGDIRDGSHQMALVEAARDLGGLDLLVSSAGIRPPVALCDPPPDAFRRMLDVTVLAPLGLLRTALPLLRESRGAVAAVSPHSAAEPGGPLDGYSAVKAALDRLAAEIAIEEPLVRVWTVDSDGRAQAPALLELLEHGAPSGHYDTAEVLRSAQAGRADTASPAGLTDGTSASVPGADRGARKARARGSAGLSRAKFSLPGALKANVPPEEHGVDRGDVRLLVGRKASGEVTHHHFSELPRLLRPLDVLVVNTSATAPPKVDGRAGSEAVTIRFSTRLDDGRWVVELSSADGGTPVDTCAPGTVVAVDDDTRVRLVLDHRLEPGSNRLWLAHFLASGPSTDRLRHRGRPFHGDVGTCHPLTAQQTVFADATEVASGAPAHQSAELPSAARPFTDHLVTAVVTRGVVIAPIELHTRPSPGAPSQPPGPELFAVPPATAQLINNARACGGRVVAVGTTAVRALESAADQGGTVRAARGWTDLVIGPQRTIQTVSGLLTGLHEAEASHLRLLEALAGTELLTACYAEARVEHYRWGEFGDVNLLLPD